MAKDVKKVDELIEEIESLDNELYCKNIVDKAERELDKLNGTTNEKVELLRTRVEKVTASYGDNIANSSQMHSREDALLLLAEMSKSISNCSEMLKTLYNNIPAESKEFKIYFYKKYILRNIVDKHEKNVILTNKFNLTKQRINQIVKKVEKKLKKS